MAEFHPDHTAIEQEVLRDLAKKEKGRKASALIPLERDIEKKVCDYATSKGMMAMKFTSPAHIGVCDRIFVSTVGKVWFAEFKQRGKKATPIQQRHHQQLAMRGVTVYLIDSVELGKEIVNHEHENSWKGPHQSAIRYAGGEVAAP